MKLRPCIPPVATAAAILLFAALPPVKAQQVVFEGDFNGTGTTTGGTSSLITFGGSGTLISSGTNVSSAIIPASSGSAMMFSGEPGYLHVNCNTGTATGFTGVTLLPSSTANSPDSWFTWGGTASGAWDTVNGGLDFFFRTTANSGSWSNSGTGPTFVPIDTARVNGGLRMIIQNWSPNTVWPQLVAYSASGTTVQDVESFSPVQVLANTVYHMALTVSTGSTGLVTLKCYLAPGDTPINTQSNAYLVGGGTTTAPLYASTITTAFNSASGMEFGWYGSGVPVHASYDYGSFRVYKGVPPVFPAVAYLPGLTLNTPNPEPSPFPANFDLFTPPFTSGTVATGTNAPAGAEWTRTGNPGDGLVISGPALSVNSGSSSSLGDDSNFAIYGESGTALLSTRANIRRLEGVSGTTSSAAAIELDQNLPNDAMYVVWPENASGTGTPLVVNQAEAWWVGWNQASPGTTASVYGRNLTYGLSGTLTPGLSGTSIIANGAPPADQSWVYLVGGGTAYRATVTAANPYRVSFTVPAVATGSSYQVWVHNGHGGHYGWSMCPGLLAPSVPYAWSATFSGGTLTGNYINVNSYGATGTGTFNESTDIQNALNAAASGTTYNTVYFPTGTYVCGYRITVPANVQLVGSGTGVAELLSGSNGQGTLSLTATSNNVRVANLTLNSGTSENTYLINGSAWNGIDSTGTITGTVGAIVTPGLSDLFTDLTLIGSDTTQAWFPTSTTIATVTVADSSTVTVSSTSGIQVSGTVSGTGIGIPAGTIVDAISGTKITLSNPATTSGSGSAVYSGTVLEAIGQSQGMVYIAPSNNVFFESCTLTGNGWDAQMAYQSSLDNMTMNSMFSPSQEMEMDVAPNDVSITNCNAQSYNLTAGGSWSGTYGQGWGFIKQDNGGGSSGNIYYGGNSVNLAPPDIETNWGQEIDMEGNGGFFYGTPTSVSGTTMVFNTGSMTSQAFVASGTWEYQTGAKAPYYQLTLNATILGGKGLGQIRHVTSMSYTGSGSSAQFTGTITVDSPWNVPPDTATSTLVLGMHVNHEVFYRNSFQGSATDCPSNVSSWSDGGVGCFGGVSGLVVDSNFFGQVDQGMVIEVPLAPRFNNPPGTVGSSNDLPASYMDPNFFHLIINNTGTGCQEGIFESVGSGTYDSIPATYGFAHVYRNNYVENSTFAGFSAAGVGAQVPTVPPRLDMVLVDSGTIIGCPAGAWFDYPQGESSSGSQGGKYETQALGNTIFTRNTIKFLTSASTVPPDPETIPDPEGYGIYWPSGTGTPSPDIALNNNTYQFDGTYTGTFSGTYIAANYSVTTPGAVLEIPQRTFSEAGNVVTVMASGTISGTSAPSVGDTMVILSNGAEPLVWTASSSAPWLTVSSPTGTISSENGSGTATFACNPLLAGTGTFTGTITYTNATGTTAGTPVKTATVTFVVNSATNP